MQSGGLDTDGTRYKSADDMWREQASSPFDTACWYQKGIDYWDKVEASVDGVLGGFGTISPNDLKHSKSFLLDVFGEQLEKSSSSLVAADCGAGVGRITKGLLSHHFTEVDVIEPVRHFLSKAEESLSSSSSTCKCNFLLKGLQEVEERPGRYDVVWIQWCIGHLTDEDCVEFLKVCSRSLKPEGLVVVKENNARRGFVLDKQDSSVTRSDSYLVQLFTKAGLKVTTSRLETDLPEGLFAVRAYALVPQTRFFA